MMKKYLLLSMISTQVLGLNFSVMADSSRIQFSNTITITGIDDPNYPPICARTKCNCSDFQYQEDAQKVLDDVKLFPNDPFGLDGVIGNSSKGLPKKACEGLPSKNSKK